MAFEVVAPQQVQPFIKALEGKRAGYGEAYRQLERDPCAQHLGAYRLSGPLEPAVCGLHLNRDYRLAFTMRPPERPEERRRVVILYVGKREPRHQPSDVWPLLHTLFGVENPPAGHDQPPCCDGGFPDLSNEELDAFLRELRRFARGRSATAALIAKGKGSRPSGLPPSVE